MADSQSLSQFFHDFGVNNRYLGALYQLIDGNIFPNLQFVVQKAIFVRSLKHVLREQMKSSEATFLPQRISHVLNCIFASEKQKQQLNSKKIQFDVLAPKEDQKKKNKKSK